MNKIILVCLMLVFSLAANAIEHPVIYTSQSEKARILELVNNYKWAQDFVASLKKEVDTEVTLHQSNPRAVINSIPIFAEYNSSSESRIDKSLTYIHANILINAKYASTLYFITDDEKYAQYAADIIMYYLEYFSTRTDQTTSVSGDYFSDPRAAYSYIAVAYDFLYNFLKNPNTKIYSKSSSTKIAYNHTKAQAGMANIVAAGLEQWKGTDTKYGKTVSNHPILSAPGVLFPILCLDDETKRNSLLDVFWNTGTKTQNSFKKSVLPMFGEQGIWPESVSYSYMPIVYLVLNLMDKVKPEYRAIEDNKHMFAGNILFMNLRYPDRRFVGYGDTHRDKDETASLFRYVLDIADRKGYTEMKNEMTNALAQTYIAEGGYKGANHNAIYDRYEELQLFWGRNIPLDNVEPANYKPTVDIKHAGIALQRNNVEQNNETYGLCGIIGGGHYVHSHLTGISMELYGAGYVMASNGNLPRQVADRSSPLHENYYRIYAGTNTVVINGSSTGRQNGSWNSSGNLWQNTAVNIAAEPKHLEDPISENFNFATQNLDDEVNNAKQQRTLGIIRTSPTTGYYVDMFRSKSNGENKFHDYIYHNLGDKTVISTNNNTPISLTPTTRYNNNIGDLNKSPGWEFFTDEKVSTVRKDAVKVRFDILHDREKAAMHLFIPDGVERDYTVGLAPPTRDSKNKYWEKDSQLLIARKTGEAWDQPFLTIFEPTNDIAPASVQNATGIMDGTKLIGAKVVSKVGTETITDYVINNEGTNNKYQNSTLNFSFEGRYGVLRIKSKNGEETIEMYIGQGTRMTYKGYALDATATKGFTTFLPGTPTNQKPVVAFDSPNIINGKITVVEGDELYVKANVVDNNISSTELFINETAIRVANTAPFQWGHYAGATTPNELDNLPVGTHTIKVIATDKDGHTGEASFTIIVKEKPTPPIVSFTEPAGNITVNEGYNLTALVNATDANGNITNVKLYIDNTLVRPDFTAPYEWGHIDSPNPEELNGLSPGSYELKAFATDNEGLTASASITLTVVQSVSVFALDMEQTSVTVYPNPANSAFFIELYGISGTANISIYNTQGQQVYQNTSTESLITIPTHKRFTKGIYLIKVTDKNQHTYNKKIIID